MCFVSIHFRLRETRLTLQSSLELTDVPKSIARGRTFIVRPTLGQKKIDLNSGTVTLLT